MAWSAKIYQPFHNLMNFTAVAPSWRSGYRGEMRRFIDSKHPDLASDNIYLVDGAGALGDPPISGQGLIKELQHQCPIDAVMANEHYHLIVSGVVSEDESNYVRRASNQILERVPVRKAHEMGSLLPSREERGIFRTHLEVSFPLPFAVIEIIEVVEHLTRDAASAGDFTAGHDAAGHRARVDRARLPAARDPCGDGARLALALFRQWYVRAATEALGADAFDVPVAGEDYLGHGSPIAAAC